MSELRDYLEQYPELEDLTPEQLKAALEEADAKAQAELDAYRDDYEQG